MRLIKYYGKFLVHWCNLHKRLLLLRHFSLTFGEKVSHRPRGCFVSEGVQRWMIILCSLQRLYGRVWLFFCSTPHLKILSNSPQEKHLLDRWLFSPAACFTFFSLKQNSLPFTLLNFSRKEVVRYAQSRGLSLWCESKCNEEITLRNFKSLINNNYI